MNLIIPYSQLINDVLLMDLYVSRDNFRANFWFMKEKFMYGLLRNFITDKSLLQDELFQ